MSATVLGVKGLT